MVSNQIRCYKVCDSPSQSHISPKYSQKVACTGTAGRVHGLSYNKRLYFRSTPQNALKKNDIKSFSKFTDVTL